MFISASSRLARSRRMLSRLAVALILPALGLVGVAQVTPVAGQIYVDPSVAPLAAYGYNSNSGQVDVTASASPGYITVGNAQPVLSYAYTSPNTTTTTTTYPGSTPFAPMTTYVQENTAVPPPNIDGIPYVVAGAEQWVSPGGSYCNAPGGGQLWVPAGASPAVYGC
jgi:hypothetical protein